MICQDVQERLTDALLGETPPSVREELLDHAAGCAACASAAAELRQTLDLLAASSWPAETVLGDAGRRRLFERARSRRAPVRWIAAAAVLAAAALGAAVGVPALQRARRAPATEPLATAPPATLAEAAPPVRPTPASVAPPALPVQPTLAQAPAPRSPEPAPAVPTPAPPVAVAGGPPVREGVVPAVPVRVPSPRPRRFPEEPDAVHRDGGDPAVARQAAQTPGVAIVAEPGGDGWRPAGHGTVSRFGFGVSGSSLALVRDTLLDGRLPVPASVRVEDFVNAVPGGEPPPDGETFAIALEAARSPFDPGLAFLRVAVRAREVPRGDRRSVRLVFVVDLSESMDGPGRLDVLKRGLRRLAERLDGGDSVGIVAYGASARVVLAPTPGDDRAAILEAVAGLQPEGASAVEEGLLAGYGLASEAFEHAALNRVVLCTDGPDGEPVGDAAGQLLRVRRRAAAGIELAVLALGARDDELLQRLARAGRGPFASAAGDADVLRFLGELSQLDGVVARGAEVEVELDPARVRAYRLLGRQATAPTVGRALRSDATSAGEVRAGQAVTALYELRVAPGEGSLGTVRVRFEQPDTHAADEASRDIRRVAPDRAFDEASARFQLTVLAGRFAEHLRREQPGEPFTLLQETALRARPRVSSLDRETEILPMIRAAGRLLGVRE